MTLPDPLTQPQFYQDVPLKRLMAWGVDTVLTFVLCLVILPFTFFVGIFVFPLLFLIVGFIYRIITIANGSATLGMRLFAIELRQANGARFDLGQAFVHTLGFSVSWAIFPIQLVSMVLMATTERRQGLSDHMLGTVMINRRATHR